MSRVFEALRRAEAGRGTGAAAGVGVGGPSGWAATLAVAGPDRSPETGPEPVFDPAEPHPTPASRLVCWDHWESAEAEPFRQMAARLLHLRERCQQERRLHSLVCTSSVAEEGKSVVAANLALALARTSGRRVLLLEGDWRRPAQAGLWGLEPSPGLGEWIGSSQTAPTPPPVRRLGEGTAYLLAAGTAAAGLEFLESPRAAQMLMLLSGWFEWVVIDTPPLLACAETHAWARLADGVLVVMRANRTRKAQVREALRALESRNLLGLVLNQNREPMPAYPPRA